MPGAFVCRGLGVAREPFPGGVLTVAGPPWSHGELSALQRPTTDWVSCLEVHVFAAFHLVTKIKSAAWGVEEHRCRRG